MKILSATLENNTLNIVLDQETNINKIYLDSILNEQNMYSDKDEDHEKVLNEEMTSKSEISIDLGDWQPYCTGVIITIKDSDSTAIAFTADERYFYNMFVTNLVSFCDTCKDNQNIHKLLMLELRHTIFTYAVQQGLVEDALTHFKDIIRLA